MTPAQLAALLAEHAAEHRVPGAAVGILRNGEEVTAYAGVADATTGEPVTAETRFAAGSLAKSVTATAVARLVDAGRLALDESVAAYVAELRGTGWGERATLRDLLANRAGVPLRDELEFGTFPGEDEAVLSRFAAEVATYSPTEVPWSYTNVGWCLVGRALETVTGLGWEDAIEAEVLRPLGLDGATFTTRPAAEPRAIGHRVTAAGPVAAEAWTPRALAPAGTTLLATLTDLLRFAAAHVRDPALAVLREPHADAHIHGWLDGWCLGLARFDWDGAHAWGWDGVLTGQRGILRFVPERRAAVVLLTNGDTGRALYRSLLPELIEEWLGIGMPALPLEPSPDAAGDLERFAGVYAWPDRRWEVSAADGRLVLQGDGRTIEALPLDCKSFLVDADDPDNPAVTFGAFDADGRPDVLYVMLWGLPRAR